MIRSEKNIFAQRPALLNFFYYLCLLTGTAFCLHPLFLLLTFCSALAYGIWLRGWPVMGPWLLKFILPGSLLVALMNLFFNPNGNTILWRLTSGRSLTLESLCYGGSLALVFANCLLIFQSLQVILNGGKFNQLFRRVLPTSGLIFTLVLRFIPRFQRQLRQIQQSQRLVQPVEGKVNWREKFQRGGAILVSLLSWSFENSVATADSMQARGYGLKGRTSFNQQRWRRLDFGLLSVMLGIVIGLLILGPTGFAIRMLPAIQVTLLPQTWWGLLLWGIFVNLPLLLQLPEKLSWWQALRHNQLKPRFPAYFKGGSPDGTN